MKQEIEVSIIGESAESIKKLESELPFPMTIQPGEKGIILSSISMEYIIKNMFYAGKQIMLNEFKNK